MEECKPSSLSLPHIRRVVDSTKLSDSISQSESLPDSMKCSNSASSGGYVKAEPVIDCTDYTGVESKASLNKSDDTKEGTEWKTAYGMTKEEKDRLSNMKEEEEVEERQSVKMEIDDGVKYSEGLGREQENVKDEQQRNSVTDQTCQTHRCQRNRGNSEYGQQEGVELSIRATTCLRKQPRVLICRLKITDISVSVSPPHPMASKEDWGEKVPHTQHELSTLKGRCSLRHHGQIMTIMTRKRKMIGQLERPQKQLPASSDNSKPNRHFLLCPMCNKTQDKLSVHLHRVCMRTATEEAITAVVEKAKVEAQELLESGRVITYNRLRQIMDDADPLSRMVEELQRRHIVVTDVPPPLPNANVPARPSTSTQPPEISAPETSETEQSDQPSVSSGETFQCDPDMQWTYPTRKLMAEKGLYKKHSLDHPLLKDFGTYLDKDLHIEHFKQEVENVARCLFYMDPRAPSLAFVRDREKTKEYFRELSEANLQKQTQQNYLKSLKRFLVYHTVNTNLRHEDEKLHGDCKHFIDYIRSLQKGCSKQVSKEITQKRHGMLLEKHPLTPHDCLAVLRAARKDFLGVIAKVWPDDGYLELNECSFVVHYLQAVVILKRLQRPGVVEHMTVKEWNVRKTDESGHAIVGVKEHKTAAQQVATFALSQEEELWFEIYYTRVRPQLLNSKKRKRDDAEGEERFFISSTGRPIYNASNDLNRLHAKYSIQSVSSQLARRVFKMATKTMNDTYKSLVADYLTHSNATAEKHYHMKQSADIVKASHLLAKLAGVSSSECSTEEGSSRAVRGTACNAAPEPAPNQQMEVQAAYEKLLQTHPVTLDGKAPDSLTRSEWPHTLSHSLYQRWLKAQKKLRVQHVLSHFNRRLPTEDRVSVWIAKQGWKSNIPKADQIVRQWKPYGPVASVMDSKQIQHLTTSQKWKGLLVTDIEGKGKSVIATRRFQAGAVVCDYHGRVITAEEGKEMHLNTSEEETRNMFFYTNRKQQQMCIDAHSVSCECHPDKETFGRLINHSRKRFNLRPRLYTVDFDGEEKDVILFLADRNIDVNEELLFDNGVQRKSFRGEGLELDWL